MTQSEVSVSSSEQTALDQELRQLYEDFYVACRNTERDYAELNRMSSEIAIKLKERSVHHQQQIGNIALQK